MKYLVIIFAVIMTGANGQLGSSAVRRIVNELSENITRLGFDPYVIPGASFNFSIPGTNLLLLEAGSGGIKMSGLSNIMLDRFRYSVSLSQATFTVTLPNITMTFNNTYVRLKFFELEFSARLNGSVSIVDTSLAGEIRISLGLLSGFSIRDADIDFSVSRIQSNLQVMVMDQDVSGRVNTFFNSTIPNTLGENRNNINELLEAIVLQAGQSE